MDQLKDKIDEAAGRANEAEQEAKVSVTTDQWGEELPLFRYRKYL